MNPHPQVGLIGGLTVKDQRPTNIDPASLMAYDFPLPALTSILHRISGIAIFIMLPLLLCVLQSSLSSEAQFEAVLDSWILKLFFWLTLSGLAYHFIAGVKHLVMDMGFGETLAGAQVGAKAVLALSVVAALILGVWVW
jgi:succinate dehydrogenase / fumarate reductase cytochrome b subunit